MSLFRRGRPFFLANRYYRISNLIDCERISVDTPTTTGAQHTRKRSRLAALTDHTGKYTLCKLNFHTHFLVVVYPFQAGTEAHQPSTNHRPPTINRHQEKQHQKERGWDGLLVVVVMPLFQCTWNTTSSQIELFHLNSVLLQNLFYVNQFGLGCCGSSQYECVQKWRWNTLIFTFRVHIVYFVYTTVNYYHHIRKLIIIYETVGKLQYAYLRCCCCCYSKFRSYCVNF